jgi:hypothetical protein
LYEPISDATTRSSTGTSISASDASRNSGSVFDKIASFHPRDRSSVSASCDSGNGGHDGSDSPRASSLPGDTTRFSAVAMRASTSAITRRYGMPPPA